MHICIFSSNKEYLELIKKAKYQAENVHLRYPFVDIPKHIKWLYIKLNMMKVVLLGAAFVSVCVVTSPVRGGRGGLLLMHYKCSSTVQHFLYRSQYDLCCTRGS